MGSLVNTVLALEKDPALEAFTAACGIALFDVDEKAHTSDHCMWAYRAHITLPTTPTRHIPLHQVPHTEELCSHCDKDMLPGARIFQVDQEHMPPLRLELNRRELSTMAAIQGHLAYLGRHLGGDPSPTRIQREEPRIRKAADALERIDDHLAAVPTLATWRRKVTTQVARYRDLTTDPDIARAAVTARIQAALAPRQGDPACDTRPTLALITPGLKERLNGNTALGTLIQATLSAFALADNHSGLLFCGPRCALDFLLLRGLVAKTGSLQVLDASGTTPAELETLSGLWDPSTRQLDSLPELLATARAVLATPAAAG